MSKYNTPLTKELLPCPFCGGRPYIVHSGPPQGIVVRCGECSARTVSDYGQPAIDEWNKRKDIKNVNN